MEEERSFSHKDILISYVRAEAAQHAVRLKEKLTEMGYSVFLVCDASLHLISTAMPYTLRVTVTFDFTRRMFMRLNMV